MASQVLTEDARRTSETVCEALVMLPVCCKGLRGREGLEYQVRGLKGAQLYSSSVDDEESARRKAVHVHQRGIRQVLVEVTVAPDYGRPRHHLCSMQRREPDFSAPLTISDTSSNLVLLASDRVASCLCTETMEQVLYDTYDVVPGS